METLDQLKDAILGQYGALVILLIIIYAGYKRWWAWGWYTTELQDNNKELREENKRLQKRLDLSLGLVKQSQHVSERTLDIAEPVIQKAETQT